LLVLDDTLRDDEKLYFNLNLILKNPPSGIVFEKILWHGNILIRNDINLKY